MTWQAECRHVKGKYVVHERRFIPVSSTLWSEVRSVNKARVLWSRSFNFHVLLILAGCDFHQRSVVFWNENFLWTAFGNVLCVSGKFEALLFKMCMTARFYCTAWRHSNGRTRAKKLSEISQLINTMVLEAYGRCTEMALVQQEEVQLQYNFISGYTWHTEWYII